MKVKCLTCDAEYEVLDENPGTTFICKACKKGVIYIPNPKMRELFVQHPTCESCKWAAWAEPAMWGNEAEKVGDFLMGQMGIADEMRPEGDEVSYENIEGECRRYPPREIVEVTDDAHTGISSYVRSSFPKVEPMRWCGEWQPKADGCSARTVEHA